MPPIPPTSATYRHPKDVPTLVVAYKRPELTSKLIDRLREIEVQTLFVSVDAPSKPSEHALVEAVLRVIESEIDWECEITLNQRTVNRGLRVSMTESIDWFFSHVSEGIILEDDCVPSTDFFRLCADVLPRFRSNPRVFQVAGDNSADVSIPQDWSYCFVRYPHIWGWATWKRAWAQFDRDLELWQEFRESDMVSSVFPEPKIERVWGPVYDKMLAEGTPDSWAFRWAATVAMHDGLSIQPLANLVSNNGFGDGATHTTSSSRRAGRTAGGLGKIRHPPVIYRHAAAERQLFNNTQRAMGPPSRIRKFKKLLFRSRQRAGALLTEAGRRVKIPPRG